MDQESETLQKGAVDNMQILPNTVYSAKMPRTLCGGFNLSNGRFKVDA